MKKVVAIKKVLLVLFIASGLFFSFAEVYAKPFEKKASEHAYKQNILKKRKQLEEKFQELNIYDEKRDVPDVSFFKQRGQEIDISYFRGKVVVLNFWSMSCVMCVAELPAFNRLQKDFGRTKFEVVSLSTGPDSLGRLRKYFWKKKYKYLDVYQDKQSRFASAMGVLGLPTAVLVNAKGEEVGRVKGIADWNGHKIKSIIRKLIKEARQQKEEDYKKETANKKMPFNRWAIPAEDVPCPNDMLLD